MASSSLLVLGSYLLILLTSFLTGSVEAQFGIPKVPVSLPDQQARENAGMLEETDGKQGFLSDTDAAEMEAIMAEAKKDIETMLLIAKMKEENSETMAELKKLSAPEIIGGMKEAFDNMKLIDYLFQDKERAVLEMEKEGMIDKAHIKKYRKDPDLLEQDTRKGLYFQFISLATLGGFMD